MAKHAKVGAITRHKISVENEKSSSTPISFILPEIWWTTELILQENKINYERTHTDKPCERKSITQKTIHFFLGFFG